MDAQLRMDGAQGYAAKNGWGSDTHLGWVGLTLGVHLRMDGAHTRCAPKDGWGSHVMHTYEWVRCAPGFHIP